MAQITKTQMTYLIYLDPAETRDIADGASVVALLAGIYPEPAVSKVIAAAAGVVAIGAQFASRNGFGLLVSGTHFRNFPLGLPMVVPMKHFAVAA